MALKVLMLRQKLTIKQAELKSLRTTMAGYKTREDDLEKDIATAATKEQQDAVETAITTLETDKSTTQNSINAVQGEITQLESDIAAAEAAANGAVGDGDPGAGGTGSDDRSGAEYERRGIMYMGNAETRLHRSLFSSRKQRSAFYENSEIKDFIQRIRDMGSLSASQNRSVTGASLGIPTVMLDLLRDNMNVYSKLMRYCTVKPLRGVARQNIAGQIPEGVWMEMIGSLNNLDIKFTQIELDGYMVGGYIPISNSYLSDSDINLGEEIVWNLGQAIGLALDKSLVYGTGTKMPVGFVTRLAATSQPAWWGTNQGDFTDLHTSNVLTLNIDGTTGASFFQTLALALAKAKPNYSVGNPVWIMNRYTHMNLIAKALAFNSSAALVSQLNNTMPLVGGDIVEEEFMADNTIAGGYLSLMLIAEREGSNITLSEHAFFLQNMTVYKGYARYDGKPVKGEGFVILRFDNTAPATTKTFATDYINSDLNALIVTSVAGTASGDTNVTVTGKVGAGNTLKYKAGGQQTQVTKGQTVNSTWTTLTSGSDITVATGKTITVVELDSDSKVISVGNVIATAKA